MKCPKCGDELMETSRGNLCLNCGYNEFAKNDTPPENSVTPPGPVRSPVTTTAVPPPAAVSQPQPPVPTPIPPPQPAPEPVQAPVAPTASPPVPQTTAPPPPVQQAPVQSAAIPQPAPQIPVASVQTVPAAVQPQSAEEKPAEIWFKSFNPVSAYIEDPKLRLLYARVNIGWYPITGAGWAALGVLVLIPAMGLLLFNRLVALGLLVALVATYWFTIAEHFGPLTLPWKVHLAEMQPSQNATWVTITGQLFFRVITALLSGLLFLLSFGNIAMLLTVPLLLMATLLLCIEIYEFIKQV
jgi:hypothetical protein